MAMHHFISLAQSTPQDLRHTLDVARKLKRQHRETGANDALLAGKTLAMVFEKPSLRTRVSFEVAMTHLGGRAIALRHEEVGLGAREPVCDIARVLSGMCDGIMARTFEHQKVLDLARFASVPVINGLTDFNHPCQAMADLLTIEEHFGDLAGRTIAFIGDGNNVARSLCVAAARFDMKFILSSPIGYELPRDDLDRLKARLPHLQCRLVRDPVAAVADADVLYTDTWVSMGQEADKSARVDAFKGYQINADLLAKAPAHAIVLHCLPAYRDLEITEDALTGPQSRVFPQAENRLHFQKGLLAVLLAGA